MVGTDQRTCCQLALRGFKVRIAETGGVCHHWPRLSMMNGNMTASTPETGAWRQTKMPFGQAIHRTIANLGSWRLTGA